MANDLNARVEASLYQQLIRMSPIPMIGGSVGCGLVAIARWTPEDGHLVVGWLVLVGLVIVLRISLTLRFRALLERRGYRRADSYRYAATMAISGVAAGLGGLLVIGATPLAMVLLVTSMQALVMGGVLTLGTVLPVFLAFAIPAVVPMVVGLALGTGVDHIILALFSVIFLGLMIGIAVLFNRSQRRTAELTFEKEDLVSALTSAHDRLAVQAETDALTGLANRRKFDEVLEEEFARLRRSRAPLSLILLDVDHFKAFNDTYGHVAGDECLKRVGAVLVSSVNRAPDVAARYGGEEFAAILPETEHQGAVALCERIRVDVAKLGIPHGASPTAPHLTVSLGVVTLDCANLNSPREAIVIVDEQLYRAKSGGRNCSAARNARPAGGTKPA